MKYEANDVREYIQALPEGFEELFLYDMITFAVPLSIYPKGYHVKKGVPLPFIALSSQKNYIALYHMGIYSNKSIYNWFTEEYDKLAIGKLDMGKSCIRFKKIDRIPYELIGDLCSKMSVQDYINVYETSLN